MLADCADVAGHRTVADVAIPAVDALTAVKARMTGARSGVGRLAAVRQTHHLLVAVRQTHHLLVSVRQTHHLLVAADSHEVDAVRVDDQVAQTADETSTPRGRPQVDWQRRGVLRPVPAESADVQAIFEVQRGRTDQSRLSPPTYR